MSDECEWQDRELDRKDEKDIFVRRRIGWRMKEERNEISSCWMRIDCNSICEHNLQHVL